MTFIDLPKIGSMSLGLGDMITPKFLTHVAGHSLVHSLNSHVRRGRRGKISRRQARKILNRKRRWFVDNIILHHKRIHDRNRALVVSNARSRALAKKQKSESLTYSRQESYLRQNQEDPKRWQNKVSLKERGEKIRGRVDSKKIRARSRWLSAIESKS